MIVWSHPFSVNNKLQRFKKVCCLLLLVVLITTGIFAFNLRTAFAAPKVLSFSARLKNSTGGVVADGFYNVQFKLYNQSTGGTTLWTESYHDTNGPSAGNDNRLKVVNGYLSAKLGSISNLGSINWEDDLWLTMNIGGTTQESDLGLITWDGEMSPRIQLTATPYSMNSGAVGGKTADDLVQIGQGKQTDSSTGSTIYLNKTGTGNLIQLQSDGADTFILSKSGSITLGAVSNQEIQVGENIAGNGSSLTVSAGDSGLTGGSGGTLILAGGDAGDASSSGGGVQIDSGAGTSGNITLGSVNASNISIGNVSSTTIVGGVLQANNLDTENAATLKLGEANATDIKLGQDTTIESGKSLTVGGDTLIKSEATNSDSAFKVQDSTGKDKLTVDTINDQVKVGVSDGNATTLILDTKNTSGDPVGTNGSMYYNSDMSKFRCYEGGAWTDCITPLPVSKVAKTDTSNSTTTPVDATDLSFDLEANTKYYYKFLIQHEADDELTGVGFGVTTPASPELSNWCANTIANLGSTGGHWGSYCGVGDASATTTGEVGVGTKFTTTVEGYIETKSSAGSMKLRFKSESANKTTVKAGSFGILQIVQ